MISRGLSFVFFFVFFFGTMWRGATRANVTEENIDYAASNGISVLK